MYAILSCTVHVTRALQPRRCAWTTVVRTSPRKRIGRERSRVGYTTYACCAHSLHGPTRHTWYFFFFAIATRVRPPVWRAHSCEDRATIDLARAAVARAFAAHDFDVSAIPLPLGAETCYRRAERAKRIRRRPRRCTVTRPPDDAVRQHLPRARRLRFDLVRTVKCRRETLLAHAPHTVFRCRSPFLVTIILRQRPIAGAYDALRCIILYPTLPTVSRRMLVLIKYRTPCPITRVSLVLMRSALFTVDICIGCRAWNSKSLTVKLHQKLKRTTTHTI